MQCPSCQHGMALCHDDRHILYYRCKHGTCLAAGVQCKHCDEIEASKKGCINNIKFIMLKHYKQDHLQLQYTSSSMPLLRSVPNILGLNNTNNSSLISVDNNTICALLISNQFKSDQSQLTLSTLPTVDTITMNQLYGQFNYFDNQQNQMYFFLDIFYPPHGGARGIAWNTVMQSANNCYNVSSLDKTQFLFKNFKLITGYSSKHCGNLMEILNSTVKYSNVNNSMIPWFPIHDKDIYKIFIGGKHSIQVNLPVPVTFNIANTACIYLDAILTMFLLMVYLLMIRWQNQILMDCMVPSNAEVWLIAYWLVHLIHQTYPSLQVTCGQMGFLVVMLGKGIAWYGP